MNQQVLSPQFGRYQIKRELGRGGMGTVYLAHDTMLERPVALKVPHFGGNQSDERCQKAVERFYREARVAASILHPNICPVFDVGSEQGMPFLTMPFLEGIPLSQLVGPEKVWTAQQAAPLMRKLALALAVVHGKGLIHRDLKPSNIFVQPDGEPVIVDFGLARSFESTNQRMTEQYQPVGTPLYMAPEQVTGNQDQMGPGTDIYALGVVLFELLTGQVPFNGPVVTVFAQILHGPVPKPSQVRAGVDPEADRICTRCMAKSPKQRYAGMDELAADLTQWISRWDRSVLSIRSSVPVPAHQSKETPIQKEGTWPHSQGPTSQDPDHRSVGQRCPVCGRPISTLASGRNRMHCPGCGAKLGNKGDMQTRIPIPAPATRLPAHFESTYPPAITPDSTAHTDGSVSSVGESTSVVSGEQSGEAKPPIKRKWVVLSFLLVGGFLGLLIWGMFLSVPFVRTLFNPKKPISEGKLTLVVRGSRGTDSPPEIDIIAGGRQTFDVGIIREGCGDQVELQWEDLPSGVQALPAFIPEGAARNTVTLLANPKAATGRFPVRLRASANRTKTQTTLVLAVLSRDSERPEPQLTLETPGVLDLEAGGEKTLQVRVRRQHCSGPVKLQLRGLPSGVKYLPATIAREARQDSLSLSADASTRPGRHTITLWAESAGVEVEKTLVLKVKSRRLAGTITNSIGLKLVLVPEGTFTMGSPLSEKQRSTDEGPQHEVRLTQPFYLGAYEVTQEEYEKVLGYNPSYFSARGDGSKDVKGMNTRRFPVEKVSWEEARHFCRKLAALPAEKRTGRVYRLPTEAEWEYACREAGKSTTPFHSGNSFTSKQGNFDGRYPYSSEVKEPFLKRPTPVGSYPPNKLGLYDMHGNVWEMCADWYAPRYNARGPHIDPRGPAKEESRVMRGGSFANAGVRCRAAARHDIVPGDRYEGVGFRVVLVVSPKTP